MYLNSVKLSNVTVKAGRTFGVYVCRMQLQPTKFCHSSNCRLQMQLSLEMEIFQMSIADAPTRENRQMLIVDADMLPFIFGCNCRKKQVCRCVCRSMNLSHHCDLGKVEFNLNSKLNCGIFCRKPSFKSLGDVPRNLCHVINVKTVRKNCAESVLQSFHGDIKLSGQYHS